LAERAAIVTGASSGIGLAIARALREEGFGLTVAARRPEPQEAKLLGLSRSAPVLAMYLSAREASGHPVLAVEVAMAGDQYELEEAYPLG